MAEEVQIIGVDVQLVTLEIEDACQLCDRLVRRAVQAKSICDDDYAQDFCEIIFLCTRCAHLIGQAVAGVS